MDSGGCALILIVLFQQHVLCVAPFVVHISIWGSCHTESSRAAGKDMECIANDAALAGMSHVAASDAASQLSAYHEQARGENLQAFCQLQKDAHADAQNVARVIIVRMCTTHDPHSRCWWPKVRIRVSSICVVVLCITAVFRSSAPNTRRKCRSSDEPTGEFRKKRFDGRNTRGFDVHASIFANASMRDTCIAKPCLAIATSGLKVESVDVRGACEQCGNIVGKVTCVCPYHSNSNDFGGVWNFWN